MREGMKLMKATTASPRRNGFTMVEILVVIAIIGILAAILVPTLAVAIKNVKQNAILFELNQLEAAMEQYAQANGDSYPPDFTTGANPDDPNSVADTGLENLIVRLNRHLLKISSSHQENVVLHLDSGASGAVLNTDGETLFDRQLNTFNAGDPLACTREGTPPDGTIDITPDEALVFWLSGTSENAAFPLSGSGDVEDDSKTLPFANMEKRRVYFEFDESRLKDFDHDGFPSYVPKYGPEVPYVYFHYSTYPIAAYQPNLNCVDTGENDVALGKNTITQARPYARSDGGWIEDDGFQIITAGYDGDYGEYPRATFDLTVASPNTLANTGTNANPGARKIFPTNDNGNFGRRDFDNLASFAEHRLDRELDF